MLHEFAVEPALLGDWHNFHYLHEKFGVPRARLISEFPKKWRRMVYEAAGNFSEMQRKILEEWLADKSSFLIASGRPYHFTDDWLQSAEAAHQEKPFRAILARGNPRNQRHIISAETPITEKNPLFYCTTESKIPKTSAGIVSACKILLQNTHELIFIDPYFFKGKNYASRKFAWGEPFEALLKCLSGVNHIKYVTSPSPSGETQEFRRKIIEDELPRHIPKNMKIEFAFSNNLHNRYMLSDIGGLKFPHGFDAMMSQQEDVVNILAFDVHKKLFAEFSCLPKASIIDNFFVYGTATPAEPQNQ